MLGPERTLTPVVAYMVTESPGITTVPSTLVRYLEETQASAPLEVETLNHLPLWPMRVTMSPFSSTAMTR